MVRKSAEELGGTEAENNSGVNMKSFVPLIVVRVGRRSKTPDPLSQHSR